MIRILLVDDDPDILKIAMATLSAANYEIETASDGLSALDALRESYFDILITDTNMPQYSGYELVQEVRKNRNLDHLSIAMLTGRRRKEDIEKALKLGADDYIVKPFDQTLFLKKVEILAQQKASGSSQTYFKEIPINRPATIELEAHIEKLSEVNITLRTNQALQKGQILHLKSSLLGDLNIPSPACKVLSSNNEGNSWQSKLMLIGVNDSILQKIRAFIYKKTSRMSA